MELTNFQVNLTPGQGSCFKFGQLDSVKACLAADLCFKEIHVDARACNVMAARGAGGKLGRRGQTPTPSGAKGAQGPGQYEKRAHMVRAAQPSTQVGAAVGGCP